MDENDEKAPVNQVCTISIMFPVETDEQAIEYKKKLDSVISDIRDARLDFRLMPVPMMRR